MKKRTTLFLHSQGVSDNGLDSEGVGDVDDHVAAVMSVQLASRRDDARRHGETIGRPKSYIIVSTQQSGAESPIKGVLSSSTSTSEDAVKNLASFESTAET
ncbi:MAG: hypothetical protein HKL86_10260 [Acidimicrobiaceae bacterium]|nr:hypothetical protein [Acidimicrobiaceae bacterium]